MLHSLKGKMVLFSAGLIVLTMLAASFVIYSQLSGGIEQSVQENASATVEDAERYIQEHLDKYSLSVDMLAQDERTISFLADENEDAWQEMNSYFEQFMAREEGTQLMYVATENGELVSTPAIDLPDDFDPRERPWYTGAVENPEGVIWTDPYIDVDTEELIITAARAVEQNGNLLGVQAVDLSLDRMVQVLQASDTGYEGELALLDAEGTYIAHTNETLVGESAAEAPAAAAVGADSGGSSSSGGRTAYFEPVEGFGWTVMAGYEDRVLYQELATARNTFIVVGLAAVLLAVAASYAAASRLVKPVRRLNEHVGRMADGDFSESVSIRGKDEIGQLGASVSVMTASLKELIGSIQDSAGRSRAMSEELSAVAEETAAASEEMASAVTGVADGASRQAEDVEQTNQQMQLLSGRLEEAERRTKRMTELSEEIRGANEAGSLSTRKLADRTEAAESLYAKADEAVSALTGKVAEIGTVVRTISEFADQTNLLALNASIEAARAGEHGRGFAVVAEEVRRLAEQSLAATTKINDTISEVESETKRVAGTMSSVNEMQKEQRGAVTETGESVESIIASVETLTATLEELDADLKEVSSYRSSIADAVASVAAVAEDAAATSEEVSASAQEQSSAVASVGSTSEQLSDLSIDLQEKTDRFRF
ncbi:methyl-accepting chemotaxis protein [Alkalicoccus luteus]|uniref:Methyl-accepting chemotaxis protein n=1 Tax=Alkalicoccus luteus TaxID=1237094 RepID=A0A969PRW0_9BACI|nr:methyl-accepting chemotaxis protein [Alkalicoccus luteus]NJP38233.1 methyl-accepting chemotaxis protein [Alkalicoccus luteus]